MADPTMEELKAKAEALVKRMALIVNEADPDKFIALAKEIEAEAKAFEALGNAYVSANSPKPPPMTTVVLTPDQRKRILDQTGVAMETIELPDDGAITSKLMPETRKQQVEAWALEEAKRRKQADQANAKAMEQINSAIADLEAVGNPDLMALLEENKKNPKFLGGLLYKKK
jgi:hypothetical protein